MFLRNVASAKFQSWGDFPFFRWREKKRHFAILPHQWELVAHINASVDAVGMQ